MLGKQKLLPSRPLPRQGEGGEEGKKGQEERLL
jgi:hypothetical protein